MRKVTVLAAVASMAVLLALRLARMHDETPVLAGTWRELRPPEFE